MIYWLLSSEMDLTARMVKDAYDLMSIIFENGLDSSDDKRHLWFNK